MLMISLKINKKRLISIKLDFGISHHEIALYSPAGLSIVLFGLTINSLPCHYRYGCIRKERGKFSDGSLAYARG